MPITLRQVVVIAVLCSSAPGCKSGPRWDWWRLGRRSTPDASPIARSAGPALPSELAQQDDATHAGGDMQMPVVDSGSQPPPYETPGYSSSGSGLAARTFPSGTSGYPSTGAPSGGGFAGSHAAAAAGDPFAHPPRTAATGGQGSTVQNGMYDPNGFAATPSPPPSTPPAVSGGSRYATSGTRYGGTSFATSGLPHVKASSWPNENSPGSQGVAAAGHQQSTVATPSADRAFSGSPASTSPATSPGNAAHALAGSTSTTGHSEAEGGRYGAVGQNAGLQATQVDEGMGGPPRYTAPFSHGTIANDSPAEVAQTPSQPYRPGGTSDYAAADRTEQVNLANRHGGADGADPQAPSPGDQYRVPQNSHGSSGDGRRY